MSAFPAHKSVKFGPKPKTPFRRTYLDEVTSRTGGTDGPTTGIEWSWDAAVPRMTSKGSRFENPQVRFYSEKQCKVNGFGRDSPGPVHAPYSDFGPAPPLPTDHFLMKHSPLLAYRRAVESERADKLNVPLMGKDRPATSTAGSGRPPSVASSTTRPISRAASTVLSRPGTVSGSRTSLNTTGILAAPRTRPRNPAASALFPYSNADQYTQGRPTPLPRVLR